jgi:hypothetical protein
VFSPLNAGRSCLPCHLSTGIYRIVFPLQSYELLDGFCSCSVEIHDSVPQRSYLGARFVRDSALD